MLILAEMVIYFFFLSGWFDAMFQIYKMNKTGELVTTDMEKAEVLSFLLQFSMVISLLTSLKSLNLKAGTYGTKSLSL